MSAGQGIVVFSTGRQDRRFVLSALASIQRHAANLHCLLLTDEPSSHPFVWCDSLPGRHCYAERLNALQYSPFRTTLLLDDDVCLTGPIPDLTKMLGDFTAAFAVDPLAPTLKEAIEGHKADRWMPEDEYRLMRGYPLDSTHYNSGVMLLDREAVQLMNRWKMEWSRFGEANQLALIRAVAGSSTRVGILPEELNSVPERVSNKTRIVHFLRNKVEQLDEHCRIHDLKPMADPVNDAWRAVLLHGQHGRAHYESVAKIIRNSWSLLGANPSLLVFGYGVDSRLWHEQTRSMGGSCCFVEDKPRWLAKGESEGLSMLPHVYKSKRGVPFQTTDRFVDLIHSVPTCNMVLVDGPHSHLPESHGREESIKAAAMLTQKPGRFAVIVAGYDRPHERVACSNYLGAPTEVRKDEKGSTGLWLFQHP